MKNLIVANWKMNPVKLVEAEKLLGNIERGIGKLKKTEVVVCPPFSYLANLNKISKKLILGAQDCFWQESGAFTGEVSPAMLKNLGCQYVIVGHSERRKYQKESSEMINKKIKAVLTAGLKPILCVANLAQLKKELSGINKEVVVAYEPLFAIGTGKACSPKKAKKMRDSVPVSQVLYGGSVVPGNAVDYIGEAGFQGLLVGGASLKAREFLQIINNVDEAKASSPTASKV
jgi:triosephosphate isomerase